MSLSALDAAREVPAHAAFVSAQGELSYAELAHRVQSALAWLEQHGCPPTRPRALGLVTRPGRTTLEVLHALFTVGAPAVLLHDRNPDAVARRTLAALGLEVLPVPEVVPEAPASFTPQPLEAERPLACLQTSGTSGAPRFVVLTRGAFIAAAAASAANLGWLPHDRWLLALPPAHVGGLSVLTRTLLARRTVVLGRGSDPGVLAADVAAHAVTLLSLVPTQLARLLADGWRPPAAVRAILVGGAATPAQLLVEAAARRWPVLTTYGLTEACSQVATQRLGTVNRGDLGVGPPLPGLDVRVRDGALEVRGPTLLSGWLSPDGAPDPWGLRWVPAPREDGWWRTSDAGSIDTTGHLHVHGRLDVLIVTGGEKVAPEQVEAELTRLDGLTEACVFGVPDAEWGALVAAVVVVAPDAQVDLDQLLAPLAERLAPHQLPRRVACLPALPRTATGKVDRQRVLELPLRPVTYPHSGRNRR